MSRWKCTFLFLGNGELPPHLMMAIATGTGGPGVSRKPRVFRVRRPEKQDVLRFIYRQRLKDKAARVDVGRLNGEKRKAGRSQSSKDFDSKALAFALVLITCGPVLDMEKSSDVLVMSVPHLRHCSFVHFLRIANSARSR